MPPKFEKVSVPPLFDFDGFDPKVIYQMVPVGGTREMAVVTDADECTIIVDPPDVARMQRFVFIRPLLEVPREFRAAVTPNNRITFQIFGQKKGNTSIFLVDRNGRMISVLQVSVKDKVRKQIAACRLNDRVHMCPFSVAEIPRIIDGVKKTYLQQANIELVHIGDIQEVTTPEDLGNPLVMDKPGNLEAVIRKTPLVAFRADFCLYFTWDLRSVSKGNIVGQNFGFSCFVEQVNDLFENSITAAHELGHGLGLSHSAPAAKGLMAADGNSRSSKIQQFEIDSINQTDDTP